MANRQLEADDPDYIVPTIIQGYIDKFTKAQQSDVTLRRFTKDSLDWFRIRISKDLGRNRQSLIKDSGSFKRRSGRENKTLIGRLYYFQYEAVEAGDRDNKVYDAFPMVFVFNTSVSSDGNQLIHALNTHYLLPKERAFLYLKLLKIRNRKGWTNATKLKITWEIIKNIVSHKIYEKAVHTYRVDRIQSKLIEIHPEFWEIATFLRMERFVHIEGEAVDQRAIRKAHRDK